MAAFCGQPIASRQFEAAGYAIGKLLDGPGNCPGLKQAANFIQWSDWRKLWQSNNPGRKPSFDGQVIWITGASSGIGEALVRSFAKRGARIVLSARREPELRRVQAACVSEGLSADKLLVLPLDVVDYDAMPAAVAAVLDKFSRIDMLINNAGMSQRSFCIDTDMQVYRSLFEVDVLGQIALTKAVLPVMVEQGSGRLVVTASLAGKFGAPQRTGYCAAKHAVMGFFDALRTEVAHLGIRGVRWYRVSFAPISPGMR